MNGFVAITGAAGALGTALVDVLLARNTRLLLLDIPRAAGALDALAKRAPERIRTATIDAADASAWSAVLDQTTAVLGPVVGAALVAGGWQGGVPLHQATDDSALLAMTERNLNPVHGALRALLPRMVAQAAGSIVVVGARPVERPWTGANAAAYTASKAAAVALAQAAAAEVAEHRVRINAVLPSMINTAANRASAPDADHARWVDPASLSAVIAFLLSDDARDVSGAAIPVYGRA